MQNIIVPTDFSIKSFNALSLAKKVAKRTKGTIHLLHVVEPIYGNYSSMGEMMEDPLNDVYTVKLVDKVEVELSSLKKAHIDPSFQLKVKVRVGDPYQEIKEAATELAADLLIIGSKGFTDAEEFFLGSLTDKVVRSIPCPVITVKEVVDEHEIKSIVYATDLEEDHQPLIKLIMRFQELFGCQIHIVKINTRKNFRNDIDTKVELQRLVDKYQLENCSLSSYSHEDQEYGIVYFADEKQADLIVIGTNEKSGFRRLISGGSLAEEVTDHTFRPVLTYGYNNK